MHGDSAFNLWTARCRTLPSPCRLEGMYHPYWNLSFHEHERESSIICRGSSRQQHSIRRVRSSSGTERSMKKIYPLVDSISIKWEILISNTKIAFNKKMRFYSEWDRDEIWIRWSEVTHFPAHFRICSVLHSFEMLLHFLDIVDMEISGSYFLSIGAVRLNVYRLPILH